MIHFQWWWILAAWPLPLLVRWIAQPAAPGQQSALRTPFLSDFSAARAQERSGLPRRWPLWVVLAAWTALVLAAARPQWLGKPVATPVSGRDLMLAVDLSGSMGIQDFELKGRTVDRLTATKAIVGNFINRRKGDRIGLILFGTHAYIQAPLTFDRHTVHQLLDEAVIGMAGRQTAIGDAIGLAVKHLRADQVKDKVLILVTDGANTAGEVSPVRAAKLAARVGLKIYTIGIGADQMLVQTLFGARRINPSQDLDARALRKIAHLTGGHYFRATDTAKLQHIYGLIDKLEPVVQKPLHFRPITALFMWPLGVALMISAALLVLVARGRVAA